MIAAAAVLLYGCALGFALGRRCAWGEALELVRRLRRAP